MTKTYYIINYKVNDKSVYWGTAKELSYVDGTTDIFKARWYEKPKDAKSTITFLKERGYKDIHLFEYTVQVTVNKEIVL